MKIYSYYEDFVIDFFNDGNVERFISNSFIDKPIDESKLVEEKNLSLDQLLFIYEEAIGNSISKTKLSKIDKLISNNFSDKLDNSVKVFKNDEYLFLKTDKYNNGYLFSLYTENVSPVFCFKKEMFSEISKISSTDILWILSSINNQYIPAVSQYFLKFQNVFFTAYDNYLKKNDSENYILNDKIVSFSRDGIITTLSLVNGVEEKILLSDKEYHYFLYYFLKRNST